MNLCNDILGVTSNFKKAARNSVFYIRDGIDGSGTWLLGNLFPYQHFDVWGFCMLILVSGGNDYGAYIVGTNGNNSVGVTTLKAHPHIPTNGIGWTTYYNCLYIEHTARIVIQIVHNWT